MPQMLANSRKFIDNTPYKDFPYDEESMRDEFVRMIEDGLCIVDEKDGIHLGGVGAVKGPLFMSNRTFIAQERFWWVVPDERAAGVGKGLLAELHVAAKKAGCDYLQMISLADPQVDKIYLSLGFTETEHCFMRAL